MEALVNAVAKYFESVCVPSKLHRGHPCLLPKDFQTAIQILIYSLSQFRLIITPNMDKPLDGVVTELKQLSADAELYLEYPYDGQLLDDLSDTLKPCELSFHTGQYNLIAAIFLVKITARTLPRLAELHQSTFHAAMNSLLREYLEQDDQSTIIMLANNRDITNPINNFVKNNRPFLTAIFSQNADDWWQQVPTDIKEKMSQCTLAFRSLADRVNANVHLKKRTPLFFNNNSIYNNPNPALTLTTFESALFEALIGEGGNGQHRMLLKIDRDEFAAFKILCHRFPIVTHLFKTHLATLNCAAEDWLSFENAKNSKKRLHHSSDDEDSDRITPISKRTLPR